jgi:hypothetical protein
MSYALRTQQEIEMDKLILDYISEVLQTYTTTIVDCYCNDCGESWTLELLGLEQVEFFPYCTNCYNDNISSWKTETIVETEVF